MESLSSDFSSTQSMEALCSLLSHPTEEEESDWIDSSASGVSGPGNIGPAKRPDVAAPTGQKNRKEIWDDVEVTEASFGLHDVYDPREQPEYEIIFKQRVSSEDLFLGLTRKDPSTACCEDMLVRIKLPGTKASDVSLQVKKKFIDLRTPKYKLGLHLPHAVDAENGKARFVSDTEALEVTLAMTREFDFINFL
ncbi:dynein axonemal assembly factor 6 [Pelodytes ibericus]